MRTKKLKCTNNFCIKTIFLNVTNANKHKKHEYQTWSKCCNKFNCCVVIKVNNNYSLSIALNLMHSLQ